MKPFFINLLLLFIVGLSACNNKDVNPDNNKTKGNQISIDSTEAKDLSEYPNTEFITTFDAELNSEKNSIYAPTMVMAWNELKTKLKGEVTKIENEELQKINKDKYFQNVLDKNEVTIKSEIVDSTIKAYAGFSLNLPYSYPLNRYEKFPFLNDTVEAFGTSSDESFISISYWYSKSNYAVKLTPKNSEHEIILILNKNVKKTTFIKNFENYKSNVKKFNEKINDKNYWQCIFNHDDKLKIPVIDFNIKDHFIEILGTDIATNKDLLSVQTFFQRNKLVLDEKGAIIESVAEISLDKAMEEIEPKPRNFYFNKPFMVFFKKSNAKYPYFAVKIVNSELLVKSK